MSEPDAKRDENSPYKRAKHVIAEYFRLKNIDKPEERATVILSMLAMEGMRVEDVVNKS